MTISRKTLTGVLLLALAAACAVPLNDVLTDKQQAQAPLATEGLAAAAPAEPTLVPATAVPATLVPTEIAPTEPAATAVPQPAPLAGNVPLAIWDYTGTSLHLMPYDPLSGQPYPGAGWKDLGSSYSTALAPDGHTLALLTFSEAANAGRIHFIDLRTWQMAEPTVLVNSYPMLMQFTADSLSLVVAGTDEELGTLTRYDAGTGAELARVTLTFTPRQGALTPDGAELLIYGTAPVEGDLGDGYGANQVAQVAALDANTLAPAWTAPLPGVRDGEYVDPKLIGTEEEWQQAQWSVPALVWAADAPRLYVVHADSDELTTVDFAAQTVNTVAVAPAQSWLDRLMALMADTAEAKILNGVTKQGVLGPDGRLYVVGFRTQMVDEYIETPLGLQVIDLATGELLETVDTEARQLRLGTDAAGAPVLLLEGWGDRYWTEVRPLADLATVTARVAGQELLFGHLPNGEAVLLGRDDRSSRTYIHVYDVATWTEITNWAAPGFAAPVLLP